MTKRVSHRTGGLEKFGATDVGVMAVSHRTGGLEMLLLCFVYRTSTTLSGFASINLAGFLLPVLLSFQCFFFAVTISCKMNHRGMVY